MFEGTITALVTPFKPESKGEPSIDFQALENLIQWQLECGVDGFVSCGTTAESVTLSPEEQIAVTKKVLAVVKGRVPVIVGTGSNCTRKTIEMTQHVKELGVDGALIVSPYYNKPTQEGLYQHFRTVAQEGGLPVVLYNIPGRSVVDISIETFKRLAEVKGIVAVKEASGSATKIIELAETVGDRLTLLSGECHLTYFIMVAGGKGTITASGNVIPKEMLAITRAVKSKNFAAALEAQIAALPSIRALFAETNPAPAKAALQMMGKIPHDTLRLPLVPVKSETREQLAKVLGLSHR